MNGSLTLSTNVQTLFRTDKHTVAGSMFNSRPGLCHFVRAFSSAAKHVNEWLVNDIWSTRWDIKRGSVLDESRRARSDCGLAHMSRLMSWQDVDVSPSRIKWFNRGSSQLWKCNQTWRIMSQFVDQTCLDSKKTQSGAANARSYVCSANKEISISFITHCNPLVTADNSLWRRLSREHYMWLATAEGMWTQAVQACDGEHLQVTQGGDCRCPLPSTNPAAAATSMFKHTCMLLKHGGAGAVQI